MHCRTERIVGDVVVLGVDARRLGEVTTGVANRITSLAADGRTRFVLDLSSVSSIDSHGLGDLVMCHQAATEVGARVALCHLHAYVAEPLRIMNVDDLFDVFDSEEDAVRSFA